MILRLKIQPLRKLWMRHLKPKSTAKRIRQEHHLLKQKRYVSLTREHVIKAYCLQF